MTHSCFVDSLSGGVARILADDVVFYLPASLLPSGVGEGQSVTITIEPDAEASDLCKNDIEDLFAELGDAP